MRWWSHVLLLIVGALIGQGGIWFGHDGNHGLRDSGAEPQSAISARKRPAVADTGVGSEVDRLVRSELGMSDGNFSFKAATRQLHDQTLSPHRTRALLAYGIQARDARQLLEDYQNKEICSQELDSVVRRLTTEDPDGMWKLDLKGKIPVKTWDDLMTVNNALVQTLTKNDAPGMIARLNQMEPSRNRIFMADSFSSAWAELDPAAAAAGFDQVLQLNPKGEAFAEKIVKSWNSKDPSAMAVYVDQLPAGSVRELFENAIRKLPK